MPLKIIVFQKLAWRAFAIFFVLIASEQQIKAQECDQAKKLLTQTYVLCENQAPGPSKTEIRDAIVVFEKVNLYGENASPASSVTSRLNVGRDDRFQVERFYAIKRGAKSFLLRRDPNNIGCENGRCTCIGWVPTYTLLFRHKNLCNYQSQQKNSIQRKIIIINPLAKEKNQNENQNDKTLFCSPYHGADKCGNAPAFRFFFLYKEYKGYFLIGGESDFQPTGGDGSKRALLGWLPKKHGKNWDTRLAVQINKKTYQKRRNQSLEGLVRVYAENAQALDPSSSPLISENQKAEAWPHSWLRWPLLKSLAQHKNWSRLPAEIQNPGDNILFHLGVFGSKVQTAIQKTKTVEIVFVIDSTESMQRYIRAARDTIVNIVESINKPQTTDHSNLRGVHFHFGLVFYRSSYHQQKFSTYTVRLAKSIGIDNSKEFNELQKALGAEKAWKRKSSGSWNESVTLGIKEAIENVGFTEHSAKIIVLIGDHGSLQGNHAGVNQPSIPEIKNALEKKGILFCALQTKNSSTWRGAIAAYQLFANQFRNLVMNLQYSSTSNTTLGGFFSEMDSQRVKEKFQKVLKNSAKTVEHRIQIIQGCAENQNCEQQTSGIPGLKFHKKAIEGILRSQGMTWEDLRAGAYYKEGYVWLYNPFTKHLQLEVMVLTTYHELTLLLVTLQRVIKIFHTGNPKDPAKFACAIRDALTGEDSQGKECQLALQQNAKELLRGLPVYTDFLNFQLREITQTTFRRRLQSKILATIDIYEHILRGKKVPRCLLEKKQNPNTECQSANVENAQSQTYTFQAIGSKTRTSFMWLPLNYF